MIPCGISSTKFAQNYETVDVEQLKMQSTFKLGLRHVPRKIAVCNPAFCSQICSQLRTNILHLYYPSSLQSNKGKLKYWTPF